jgi:hypothetical protein
MQSKTSLQTLNQRSKNQTRKMQKKKKKLTFWSAAVLEGAYHERKKMLKGTNKKN